MTKPKEKKTQKHKTNSPKPTESIVAESISQTNETQNDKIYTEKRNEPFWSKITRNWLIVIFTGSLTYYTFGLYELTVKQSGDAEKTFSLLENNSRIENRAWVGLKSEPQFGQLVKYNDYTISATIVNFGKTPATILCFAIDTIRFYGKTISPLPEIKKKAIDNYVIQPKETRTVILNVGTFLYNNSSGFIKPYHFMTYGKVVYRTIYGDIDSFKFHFTLNQSTINFDSY